MTTSDGHDNGERVRQHVRKVLAQLRALQDQQGTQTPDPPALNEIVEVEREENGSAMVGGDKTPS